MLLRAGLRGGALLLRRRELAVQHGAEALRAQLQRQGLYAAVHCLRLGPVRRRLALQQVPLQRQGLHGEPQQHRADGLPHWHVRRRDAAPPLWHRRFEGGARGRGASSEHGFWVAREKTKRSPRRRGVPPSCPLRPRLPRRSKCTGGGLALVLVLMLVLVLLLMLAQVQQQKLRPRLPRLPERPAGAPEGHARLPLRQEGLDGPSSNPEPSSALAYAIIALHS